MIELVPYTAAAKDEWDRILEKTRNGYFLFKRDYMDYHSDRFFDCSFLIRRNGKPEGLLPGNLAGNVWYSHQGLTFGGALLSAKMRMIDVLELFEVLDHELKKLQVKTVVYKPIPYFYSEAPCQEDLYALFRRSAHLKARQISSTISYSGKISFSETRKQGTKKARQSGIVVVNDNRLLPEFWAILEGNLRQKYQVSPTHSLMEISLLADRFPRDIQLYSAHLGDEMLGGCLFYLTRTVAHCQYISASASGKELNALDLLIAHTIEQFSDRHFFDFGTSNEQAGRVLNEQLIFQKEGFGGRGAVYDTYEYQLVEQ